MPNSNTYRLFVAISLPEQVKDELAKTQTELRRTLSDDCVRWARREQFHLTLKFLGNVEVGRLDSLSDAVRRACEDFSSFLLRAGQIGFFPDARRPRVIWAGVQDAAGRLPSLQNALEAVLDEFARERGEPTFTGHITLGRFKFIKRPGAEIVSKLVPRMAERFFGEWSAQKVEIVRSELSPNGSVHTTLVAVPLATGSQPARMKI